MRNKSRIRRTKKSTCWTMTTTWTRTSWRKRFPWTYPNTKHKMISAFYLLTWKKRWATRPSATLASSKMITNKQYRILYNWVRISILRLWINRRTKSTSNSQSINIWPRHVSFVRSNILRMWRIRLRWRCFVDIRHALPVSSHPFLRSVSKHRSRSNVCNVWKFSNVGSIREEISSLEANIAESKINWVKFKFQTLLRKYQMSW